MISVRKAKYAVIGLQDLIIWIRNNSNIHPVKMSMVEIGCYVGDSTRQFAKNFKEVNCIDPWENGYDDNDLSSHKYPMTVIESQFDLLMDEFSTIKKYKMKSGEAVSIFEDRSLDFVYIDGLHTYDGVKNDIEKWLPKVKNGGFIGGHDYNNKHHVGVKPAVDSYFEIDATFRDTSWIKKVL